MRDRDLEPTLPWRLMLLLNSLCYFAFAGFMKLLNNNLPVIFFWIGIASFAIGFIASVGSILSGPIRKKELLSTE
jgi:ABC-type transport system involved in cytochrome c biogenesis permease component